MTIGYVAERVPRLNDAPAAAEIAALGQVGVDVELFSLSLPRQPGARVVANGLESRLWYLIPPDDELNAPEFYATVEEAPDLVPDPWVFPAQAADATPREMYQAVRLAGQVLRRGIRHLHSEDAAAAASVARLAARLAGIPYSLSVTGPDLTVPGREVKALRRKLADAAAILVRTRRHALMVRDLQPEPPVRLIYHGIEVAGYLFEYPGSRPPRIVAAGNLSAASGLQYLVDACGFLRQRGHRFECLIAGTGPLEDEIRSRIRARGLDGTVRLEQPASQEVVGEIQGAAALVAPFVFGGSGLGEEIPSTVLRAMAVGTPCVVTDAYALPEVVHDNETGLMVPQRSPAMLAVALERLLHDPGLRSRIAIRARALVEEQFDLIRNAASLAALFRSQSTGGRPRGRPPASPSST
ncbi:MAG: glycosyltransferase family 4 protein [Gemmatimonadales bacterium]